MAKKEWPKRFRTVRALVEAMVKGEIPADVVSAGAAAATLGVTRQAVHHRIRSGSLRAWIAEGNIVLVSTYDVRKASREKRGIPPGQGELYDYSPSP